MLWCFKLFEARSVTRRFPVLPLPITRYGFLDYRLNGLDFQTELILPSY
jgi:hypothetical protein